MRVKVQMSKFKVFLVFMLFTVHYSLFTVVYAAHPLITDDTGTQGKGKFQIEVNSEFGHDKEAGVTENRFEIATVLSYGIFDNLDIVLGIPYQHIKVKDSVASFSEGGLSDISLELKWRFYEKDGLSFALKPGITFPAGDEEKGLGTGKATYGAFLIGTKTIEPWAFHLNLGYVRNENTSDEREDIWHASIAAEYEVIKDLKVVANIGTESNPDKSTSTNPAFILGGIIYAVSEAVSLDVGVKAGINSSETDYTILAGIAMRF
jgi:hypothetical protein